MRAIKFRAWYAPEKTMWDWNSMLSELSSWDKPFESTADWKVMQFTGLKDRDGRDIWEGDVIRCYDKSGGKVYDIEVKIPRFYQEIWSYNEYGLPSSIGDRTKVEVIGNVHQHPELITSLAKPE